MRVYYCSDVHLEFGLSPKVKFNGLKNDSKDVMLLAGDITLLHCLDEKKTDQHSRKTRERTLNFLRDCVEKFDRVFYIAGNHECYRFDICYQDECIQKYIEPLGVIYLQEKSVNLTENTILVGGTLWTNMNNHNESDMMTIKEGMNDFHIINKFGVPFSPHDAYKMFQDTFEFIRHVVRENKNKKIVVMTHHSPTKLGLNPFHGGNVLDYGYASDLDQFILDNENITHWVFGHTHVQKEFEIGKCKLHSNACGYVDVELMSNSFSLDKYFEV